MSIETTYNIMLIDDEPNILTLYSALLTKNGYTVYTFDTAKSAIDHLNQSKGKTDLIISDVNMPEMTGIQFLEHIKQDEKHASIPVIFLSAISDSQVHVDAFDSGAIDFLTKPVKKEIFLSKIKALLKSYSIRTLRENIYLDGDKQDNTVEEIISVCETEGITGFTVLFTKQEYGVLHFKGGMLEDIECGSLRGAEAFEEISSWEEYGFKIIHGRYDEKLVREFILPKDKKNIWPSATNKPSTIDTTQPQQQSTAQKHQSKTETDSADTPLSSTEKVHTKIDNFTYALSRLIKEQPTSAELEFTNKNILYLSYADGKSMLTTFDNKKAWRKYQIENDLR